MTQVMEEGIILEEKTRYGAVIVAAGISIRMGRLKPMLSVGGESIIKRMIRMMREVGTEQIVVVTGYHNKVLEEHLKDELVEFVYNSEYVSTKMVHSLTLGLQALEGRCDRILFSPGDIPMIESDTLQLLIRHKGQFVRPVFNGKTGHPVVFDADIIPKIIGYQGKDGLRGILEENKVAITDVPVRDAGIVMDVDTKVDYEELLRQNTIHVGDGKKLRMELNVCLGTDEMVFDASTATLMELISITGSMRSACQAMHISYTKAWKKMRQVEEKFHTHILQRNVGGTEGGSTRLTDTGMCLLENYDRMMKELEMISKELFQKYLNSGKLKLNE